MAIVKITPVELDKHNIPSEEVTTSTFVTALDASAGAYYEHKERDDKYVIIAQNAGNAAANLTFKHGNGIQGVVDKVVSIGAGKTRFITLESGAFKFMSGENKGRVLMTGSADIKVAVVKLP